MAGVPQAPDESILEYLFYTQVRYHSAIARDIAEHQRAEQGTPKHSYEYLVSAVRLQLEHERLDTNRERIAPGLGSGAGIPRLIKNRHRRRRRLRRIAVVVQAAETASTEEPSEEIRDNLQVLEGWTLYQGKHM